MTKKNVALALAFLLFVVGFGVLFVGAANADKPVKVDVCHRTASETNPYVLINVPEDKANGHITGTSKQHNKNVTWPVDTTWNGVFHAAGSLRLDYLASAADVESKCANSTPPVDVCPDVDGVQTDESECDSTPPTEEPPVVEPPVVEPPVSNPPKNPEPKVDKPDAPKVTSVEKKVKSEPVEVPTVIDSGL